MPDFQYLGAIVADIAEPAQGLRFIIDNYGAHPLISSGHVD